MKREVFFTQRAEADIDATLAFMKSHSQQVASKWFAKLADAIEQLENAPERFALCSESDRFPIELRQYNFGVGVKLTHRLVYTIRPNRVVVYAVRHLAQDAIGDELLEGE